MEPDHDRRRPPSYPGQGNLVAASRIPLQVDRPAWLRGVSIVAIAAVAGVVVFGGYWAVRLVTNVDALDLSAGGGRTQGVADDMKDRLQILVLGSDTRSGPNADYGSEDDAEGYGQADVMMLLDLAEDNSAVNVLSFPRDLLVDIPSCVDGRTGQRFEERPGAMINSAMRDAGPGCAVDTVSDLTGLEIDHFMLADFHAVTELSNAVGGVEVCVTERIDEPKSGLKLPAGTSSVQGEQALAFLRARAAFGDGGDLGRIKAQQAFLGSLVRKIKDEGTLRKPQRILAIADALTSNLTVDRGLASIPAMVTIADRLKDVDPTRVSFIAVPTVPAADPNRLDLDGPMAAQLFAALRADADLSGPADDAADDAAEPTSEEPAPDEGSTPEPGTAPVTIADGTGQVYLGADAEDGLDRLEGPDVTGTINQTADQVSCQDTNPFG